ncbi:MAG TPA: hypothetical protein VJ140_07850 [Actinomycetota bacterium]|nr:hypothetical protein [Actinomycetota bacterium]
MNPCPKCGGETQQGYGLAGGGCGVYTFCLTDGCDYFDKTQDGPEEWPACAACSEATGGVCPKHAETECTCYELTGGHQPGCAFNVPRRRP